MFTCSLSRFSCAAMMAKRKQSTFTVFRPICFFIILMLVVLCLAGVLIPLWKNSVTKIENGVGLIAHNTNGEIISRIKKTAASFSPINASSINLARILTPSLDTNDFHFPKIKPKIPSPLFQALSTIPYLSQIAYIELNGLFFAYYKEDDQPYALFSNSTLSDDYTWYKQRVNRDTGNLYGGAMKSPPSDVLNSSWFQQALKSENGYASVESGWADSRDIMLDMMLLNSVGLDGKGVISLGFPMAPLIRLMLDDIASYNGSLFLATMDGNVLTQGLPNVRMIFDGVDQASFRLLDDRLVGNITCRSDQEGKFRDNVLSFSGRKYTIICSFSDIAGIQFMYVIALPQNEFSSIIDRKLRLPFVLLILMVCGVVMIICIFVYVMIKAVRREMYLCGALINQMEATQQSERKSMNKSLAFASASHDIRASLAGICGLIEICRNEVTKRDHLLTSLSQMEACTRDLLGILNSILDTSKIEAGKMQLEEEVFDVEELLEDVVDLYHPVGLSKGVDVILDPYDGSILKLCRVRGDRGKLKQVLINLLSNAVKFTSEGHVVVRAKARKPSLDSETFALNQRSTFGCCLMFKIGRANDELDVVNTMIQMEDPNSMEFIFEVNDTGKGIPKERKKYVFENYVQVKENSLGQEGTGLGLGIVQSLVRLMGGEIRIVDKEVGERGTCFKFNVFLSTTEMENSKNSRTYDVEMHIDNISGDSFQQAGRLTCIQSPKLDGSQVILFIESVKRSSILCSYLQRLGIKVHLINQHHQLSQTLKKIKRNFSSSGNSRSEGFSSRVSSTRSRDVPLSALDGIDTIVGSSHKRTNARPGFILIVIDTRAGPFREITRAVAEFRKDLGDTCYSRVVWLDQPDVNNKSFDGLDEDKLPSSDIVISKPFHGFRLYQTIKLLPEFGGQVLDNVEKVESRRVVNEIEEGDKGIPRKPLMGKRVLVADDDPIGRKIATSVVSQLGASVFSAENGDTALKLVCGDAIPFDCILMDCEMPVTNGSEATARIREVEKDLSVHTPIIALTAHKKGEETEKMFQAGVDAYITKPLNKDNFFTAISQLIRL